MTKLYFHAATSIVGGTLPTTEQSSLTSIKDVDAQTVNRSMDTIKGTAQASVAQTSNATVSLQDYYFTRFVSTPLNQSGISANTWNYAFAAKESNAAGNFPCSGASQSVYINVYVWRPSNGTKVGTILDGNTNADFTEPSGTTEQSVFGTFTGAAVAGAAANDVIICEIWFRITQGGATGRTETFYFDGTTETNNNNTVVSNHASYIETPQTLVFFLVRALTETAVTVSDSQTVQKTIVGTTYSSISTKKGTITLDTTSGVHDQAFTGIGFQPKAIIFWGTFTTGSTYTEGASAFYGFTDGTTSCSICGSNVDNVSTTDSAQMIRNDACINLMDTTSSETETIRATLKTLDSDGFTLTYNVKTNTTQYILHYLAVGGSSISNVKAVQTTTGTVATGNHGHTGVGFKPDIVLFACCGNISANTNTAGFQFGIGAGISNTEMFSSSLMGANAVAGNSGNVEGIYISNARCLQVTALAAATNSIQASFVSLDSDGFTINHVSAAAATTFPFLYLAIKGGFWDVGTFTQKTSSGSQTITPVIYADPEALLLAMSDSTTLTANQAVSAVNFTMAIGGCDNTSQGFIAFGSGFQASPTNMVMISSTTKLIRGLTPNATATSSTTDAEADVSDMTVSGGILLNWTTADAVARQIGYITLGKTAPGSGGTLVSKSLTETVSISESLARLGAKLRALSAQTVSISETPVRLAAKIRALATQTTVISESLARLAAKKRALSTETITVTAGTLARIKGSVKALATETVTVTSGTLARLTAKIRALATQTVAISESIVRVKGKVKTLTETVTISDSIARLTNKIRALATQTTTITETPTRLASKFRALTTQTVTISESVARLVARSVVRTLTETVTVSAGTLTRIKGVVRTTSQTTTISEAIARLSAKKRALSTETVAISESIVRIRGIVRILATQTITVSETITRLAAKTRALTTQTVAISESVTRLSAKSRALAAQTVTIGDSIARTVARIVAKALTEATITISESISRLAAKRRAPAAQTVTIAETPVRLTAKIRALTAQTITISDAVARIVTPFSGGVNVVRALTETVVISETLARLAKKIRALSPETAAITESIAKSRGKARALATQTTAISESIARRTQKIRIIAEAAITLIEQEIKVFKNGILLVALQRPSKGGFTVPYKKPILHKLRLKQILYPVYHVTEFERLQRRRKLQEYPPLVIIPAFKYNINQVTAPFVITNRIQNTVYVRFAIASTNTRLMPNVVFTGADKAVPIAIVQQQRQRINKARCAHVMNQQAIERYGKKLNKVSKLMSLWSIFSSLHQS